VFAYSVGRDLKSSLLKGR